jgi:transcription elongation factor Elf1
MVHYDPPMFAAQIPPPICPKCGSHRTVIVGRSDDGETIVLRCNACGERTELSTNDAYTMPRTHAVSDDTEADQTDPRGQ